MGAENAPSTMGSASSKSGAAVGRSARSIAKAGMNGKPTPSTGSHLPVEDDLLTNFKPTKGKLKFCLFYCCSYYSSSRALEETADAKSSCSIERQLQRAPHGRVGSCW